MKILTITCENLHQVEEYTEQGCDEVILSLQDAGFTSLHCFSIPEIQEAVDRNPKRTSVLMNRLFGEEEMEGALVQLEQILSIADAVYFADPALLRKAQQLHRADQMIYRPETLLTSSEDGAWWMKQGLQSVEISPLLTAEEICTIAGNVPHTSLQIHGRLLMSVSKRKLLSAYSEANGLPSLHEKKNLYLREESREGKIPIYENAYGTLIDTDYLQESFDYIHAFMDSGVERYEIDTIGLKEDAIQDAIKIYRDLLDGKNVSAKEYLAKYKEYPFETGYYGQKTVK